MYRTKLISRITFSSTDLCQSAQISVFRINPKTHVKNVRGRGRWPAPVISCLVFFLSISLVTLWTSRSKQRETVLLVAPVFVSRRACARRVWVCELLGQQVLPLGFSEPVLHCCCPQARSLLSAAEQVLLPFPLYKGE